MTDIERFAIGDEVRRVDAGGELVTGWSGIVTRVRPGGFGWNAIVTVAAGDDESAWLDCVLRKVER